MSTYKTSTLYRKEDFQNIIYFKLRKKQNNIIIKIKTNWRLFLGLIF